MKTYRILVTGWRGWPPSHAYIIDDALDDAYGSARYHGLRTVVVHGACPYGGVDAYAQAWAERWTVATEAHLGPERNSKMVDLGAAICLAFPGVGSRGTWDCVRKAVDADIPVRLWSWHSKRGKGLAS